MSIQHWIDKTLTVVSEDFEDLTKRKRELDSVSFDDPHADREIMAESYDCLASDFEQDSCSMLAHACRRAADRWRQ